MNYEEKDQDMPEEELKDEKRKIKAKREKKTLKVRINSLVERNEQRREYNDASLFHHHVAVHHDQTAVGIVNKTLIASLGDQSGDGNS